MLTLAEYLFSTCSPFFTYIWQHLYFLYMFSSLNYKGFLFNIPSNILIQDLFRLGNHHAFYSGDQLARSMPIRPFYPPIHQFIAPLHHFASNALRCVAVQIEVGAVR